MPVPPAPTHSPPLSTSTDIADEDTLEEDFRRRRQNALPGLPLHQRYLRNTAQNPSEEEEEQGLQSLGLTRGPELINEQQSERCF